MVSVLPAAVRSTVPLVQLKIHGSTGFVSHLNKPTNTCCLLRLVHSQRRIFTEQANMLATTTYRHPGPIQQIVFTVSTVMKAVHWTQMPMSLTGILPVEVRAAVPSQSPLALFLREYCTHQHLHCI